MNKLNAAVIDFYAIDALQHLEPHVLDALQNIAVLYRLQSKEMLYRQGEPATSFYIVQSGGIRLVEHTAQGRNMNIKVYGAGDMFGLLAVSGVFTLTSSAQAVEASEVISIRGDRTRELMLVYPRLGLTVIDTLVGHIQHAHERIRHLAVERVEQRIARCVVHFCLKFGKDGENGVTSLNLSQQDIAEFSGTTVETVNRILRGWEDNGRITRSRQQIDIHHLAALQTLADDGADGDYAALVGM